MSRFVRSLYGDPPVACYTARTCGDICLFDLPIDGYLAQATTNWSWYNMPNPGQAHGQVFQSLPHDYIIGSQSRLAWLAILGWLASKAQHRDLNQYRSTSIFPMNHWSGRRIYPPQTLNHPWNFVFCRRAPFLHG